MSSKDWNYQDETPVCWRCGRKLPMAEVHEECSVLACADRKACNARAKKKGAKCSLT